MILCEYATETRLQVPLLSDARAGPDAGPHLWVCALRLQVGSAPAHRFLLPATRARFLSRLLGGLDPAEPAARSRVVERGFQRPAPTGTAPSGPSVPQLLRGACSLSWLQEEAWPSSSGIHH